MGTDRPRIILGYIAAAHGVRGDVLVRTYTEAPEDIASYGPLADEAGGRQFTLKIIRTTSKGVVARISGVTDRNAAEALKGVRLYVDREKLPTTADDEFYLADLIGLQAVASDGTLLGEVADVHNFGAGDILEIRLAGKRSTELLPFTRAFVPDVDLQAKRLTIVLPSPDSTDDEEAEPEVSP